MNEVAKLFARNATLRAYRGFLRNYRSASVEAAMQTAASLGRFEIYKSVGGQWQAEIVAERENGSVLHARNFDPDPRAAIDAAIVAALGWLPLADDPDDRPAAAVAAPPTRRNSGDWYCERKYASGWIAERHYGKIPYGAGEGWGETTIQTAGGPVKVRRVRPIPAELSDEPLSELNVLFHAAAAINEIAPEAPFVEVAPPEPRADAS